MDEEHHSDYIDTWQEAVAHRNIQFHFHAHSTIIKFAKRLGSHVTYDSLRHPCCSPVHTEVEMAMN